MSAATLSACIVIILYYNSACLSVHKVVLLMVVQLPFMSLRVVVIQLQKSEQRKGQKIRKRLVSYILSIFIVKPEWAYH